MDEIKNLRKKQTVYRRFYTIAEKKLADAISAVDHSDDIHSAYIYAKQKAEELFQVDTLIREALFSDESQNVDELQSELALSEEYVSRWTTLSTKYERKYAFNDNISEARSQASSGSVARRMKLPKIELRKFNGDLKNWIGFWGQFVKIHNDQNIDDTDKYQYLYQATEPGSKARELVESFPSYGKNYQIAIEQLKNRYARDDLLIEHYIREVIALILDRSGHSLNLSSLYDKLSTYIKALESLKVTSDKFASMLLPMVESTLPTDVLMTWERNRERKDSDPLLSLMKFLKREVESEERIAASRQLERASSSKEPTASCLAVNETKKELFKAIFPCLWCDKETHSSLECFKLNKLSFEEKNEIIKKKKACYICLKIGHSSKRCKSFPKCLVCSRRHMVPMCPDLGKFKSSATEEKQEATQVSLCTKNTTTLLPTIVVDIIHKEKRVQTKALLDSGAQMSYIRSDLTKALNLPCLWKGKISHCLFGGCQVLTENSGFYKFKIGNKNNSFSIDISAYEQKKLMGPLPKLTDLNILKKLDTVSRGHDGRYEVHLPWKEGFPEELSQTNKFLALKRLDSTTKKLVSSGYLQKYDEALKSWLQEGIIEEVQVQASTDSGLFLPHHAVIKESSSTTPVRPVFDASAKDRTGNSLNSSLEKGTNLLEVIPKLLIRFRKGSIGIISDIRKAFLQISVTPRDRDYLKFLWWRDIESKKELVTYRHKRVVFGVTSSPFLLGATINYHLDSIKDNREPTAKKLKSSFYVDNCVTSVQSAKERDYFINTSKDIMAEACFDLRGWVIGPNICGESISLLGLMWDTKEDTLNVNFKIENIDTKRVLLSHAQRLFDPIGFTCPATLTPKLLLQRSWLLKIDWDAQLPEDMVKEFKMWLSKMVAISDIHIPRRLSVYDLSDCKLSLHTFCDASKYAFATCIFLRSECNGNVNLQLVEAKSRVAPLKTITIPRLELMAALIGVRLHQKIHAALLINNLKSYFWTDSAVVLTWIQKDGNWPLFVKNRVREIHSVTRKDQWRHVAGSLNPCDLPSRGCNADTLKESCWWKGPGWLYLHISDWPYSSFTVDNKSCLEIVEVNTCTVSVVMFLPHLLYFSSYLKIVRIVAWMFRFCHNCKLTCNNRVTGEITYSEFSFAEKVIFKRLQLEEDVETEARVQHKLDVFIDPEGLLRIKTRLVLNTSEGTHFKFPILLPGSNPIVKRLIYQVYISLQHAGVAIVLSNLREYYWVLNARKWVKKVLSECTKCKRLRCKAASVPVAPLPLDRINNTKVFETCGIDLCGPLLLNSGHKSWVVVFTCTVYRAVHFEIVLSLSAEAFIMALRRFIARRGRISVIISDNGTNFIKTNNLLKDLNWEELQRFSNVKRFEWKFNAPAAPWWGGFFERLIRILKGLLRRVLGNASLSYVELETLLCDCESTMNSRPLTYIADDVENPLTPACFLHDVSETETTDLDLIDSQSLTNRHRFIQSLRDQFRVRFRSEYLGLLANKYSSSKPNRTLKVGDVVLLQTEDKRQFWPLAIILEIFQGKD